MKKIYCVKGLYGPFDYYFCDKESAEAYMDLYNSIHDGTTLLLDDMQVLEVFESMGECTQIKNLGKAVQEAIKKKNRELNELRNVLDAL